MSLTERPTWRMTRCEAYVLLDLDALAHALRIAERWVPEPLILLCISARKNGKPFITLRNLQRQGYVQREASSMSWRRTDRSISTPDALPGDPPHVIPPGALQRLAKKWKCGRRSFTLEDLAATPPGLMGVPESSPKRGRA